MLIVTTPSVEGYRVKKYIGLVTGEAILGANMFKDIMAGFRDIVGGRSAAYEAEIGKAKTFAINEMTQTAVSQGANAILSVDLDFETIGANGSMLMVAVSGTAVVLEKENI
ncbi:MAG: heavy metal-binding domain-containing protein [Ignavibacteriaceae bacterium]|nr:heavy metal-binding domain-containing protein [Ignavibacteriaceae bacterium]